MVKFTFKIRMCGKECHVTFRAKDKLEAYTVAKEIAGKFNSTYYKIDEDGE